MDLAACTIKDHPLREKNEKYVEAMIGVVKERGLIGPEESCPGA